MIEQQKKCSVCGASNSQNREFCWQCGISFVYPHEWDPRFLEKYITVEASLKRKLLRRRRAKQMLEDWIWIKADTKKTFLVLHKSSFKCEYERCNRETRLTSHGNYGGAPGIGHPVCEEHYKELHAYHQGKLGNDIKHE